MMANGYRVWLIGIALLSLPDNATLSAGSTEPTLEKILADWWHRRHLSRVKYVVEGEILYPKGSPSERFSRGEQVPPDDLRCPVKQTYHLDFQGNRLRKEWRYEVYVPRVRDFTPRMAVFLYDGSLGQMYTPRRENTSRGSVPDKYAYELALLDDDGTADILEWSDYPVLLAHGILDRKQSLIRPECIRPPLDRDMLRFYGNGVLKGREHAVLRSAPLSNRGDDFYEVWVDVGRDSAITRWVAYLDGKEVSRLNISYGEGKHGWMPESWEQTHYVDEDLAELRTCRVIEFAADPRFERTLFQVEPMPGVIVYDQRSKAAYRKGAPGEANTSIDDERAQGEVLPWYQRKSFCLLCALFAAVGWVILDRRRQSPATRLVESGENLWFARCALLVILAVAVLARCYRLPMKFPDLDEAFTLSMTGSGYSGGEIAWRSAADVHPPGHYLVLAGWRAVFGTSLVAARALSTVFGVLCVGLSYLLCLEALRAKPLRKGSPCHAPHSGALLCAALVTTNSIQVHYARNVRMYGMGIFLAVLSSWLLLRALKAERRQARWWAAYGLTVAAFCYTHNYAMLSVFAQTLFVIGDLLVQARRTTWRAALRRGLGFLFAGTLALACYSPWVPVLWRQMRGLQEGYWIPEFSWGEAAPMLETWAAGLWSTVTLTELYLVAFLMALLAAFTIRRSTWAGWFFLTLTLVPLILSVVISSLGNQSVLLMRCLIFARVSLCALLGTALTGLPRRSGRFVLAAALLGTNGYVLSQYLLAIPKEPPPHVEAARFLSSEYQPGDVILTANQTQLYRLQHYLQQAGLREFDARTPVRGTRIQGLEANALRGENVLLARDKPPAEARRIWTAASFSAEFPPVRRIEQRMEKSFQSPGGPEYYVRLYVATGQPQTESDRQLPPISRRWPKQDAAERGSPRQNQEEDP